MICYISLLFLSVLYVFFDVNYFLRMAFTLMWIKLFKKRQRIFDEYTCYGLCLSMDLDIFLHMNNARYLRELDFLRLAYYDRIGILEELVRKGASTVQGATYIRYRRAISFFTIYKVTTQLVYWDDKSLYLQYEFISLSDGFVCTTVLGKQSITGTNIYVPDIVEKLEPGAVKPKLSDELRLWLQAMQESSLKFKRQRESLKSNVLY